MVNILCIYVEEALLEMCKSGKYIFLSRLEKIKTKKFQ